MVYWFDLWRRGGSLLLFNNHLLVKSYDIESFDKYDEPRLHMERLLKSHLIDFDLSLRILIPLEKAGIRTLGDLVKQSRKSLGKIHQLGALSVGILDNLVTNLDLSLAKE